MGEPLWEKRAREPKPLPHNQFEVKACGLGYSFIAGLDEAGRGCLAGPVVAACVVLPWRERLPVIRDSKQWSPKKREICFHEILEVALDYGIGRVESEEIDDINILRASLKAMRLAIAQMKRAPDYLLVDGNQPVTEVTIVQETVVQGDQKSVSIAAASILAKVTRDRLMTRYDSNFPEYQFSRHKGYGTEEHLALLRRFGPTPIHRRSFRGVL